MATNSNRLRHRRTLLKRLAHLSKDTWIATHSPIAPERLHALGYVTFVWNSCEHNLFSLLAEVSQMPEREAWIMAHDLGDIAIMVRIKEFAALRYPAGSTQLRVINAAVEMYDTCRQNRNLLSHFSIAAAEQPELSLRRRSKKPKLLDTSPFPDDKWALRRVGSDLRSLNQFLKATWWWLFLLREGEDSPPPEIRRSPKPLWTAPIPPSPRKKRQHQHQSPQV